MTPAYLEAKKRYDASKRYKFLGAKISPNAWLSYDEENDEYVYSWVKSKYYIDEKGKTQKASAGQRDKYTMLEFARVGKVRTHLQYPVHNGQGIGNLIWEHFDTLVRKNPSIKEKGLQWTLHKKSSKHAWAYYYGHGESNTTLHTLLSGSGVYLANGVLFAESLPAIRTFDKTKQKELNGRIKEVRRMLGLRARLGVFNSMNWASASDHLHVKWSRRPNGYPTADELLSGVKDDNLDSMIPVLVRAMNVVYVRNEDRNASDYYLRIFNKYIEQQREGLRNANGVVSYVSQNTAQEVPNDEGESQETGDRPSA